MAPPAQAATLTPTLSQPLSSQSYKTIPVTYTLPETAGAGTVRLTFDSTDNSHDLSLTLTRTAAGSYSFLLNPANPLSNVVEVASSTPSGPLVNDTYTVVLSYQNAAFDPVATTTAAAVTVDTVTQAPSLTSPTNDQTVTGPFTLSYSLPETPLTGSTKIVFTPSGGGQSLTLTLGNATVGSESWLFDPSSPTQNLNVTSANFSGQIPDGSYDVSLQYRDALDNPLASTTVTGMKVSAPSSNSPDSDGGNNTTPTPPPPAVPTPTSAPIPSAKPKQLTAKWSVKRVKRRTAVVVMFRPVGGTHRSVFLAHRGRSTKRSACKTKRLNNKNRTLCTLSLSRGTWLLNIESTDMNRVVVGTATRRLKVR